jgi:hypothetical protein
VSISGTESWHPVRAGGDLLWPVQVDAPGIHELTFDAMPGPDAAGQWFVRLETSDVRAFGWTRRFEPVDLSEGPRRVRILFDCPHEGGPLNVRIQAETGTPLSVRQARFGRIAGTAPSGSGPADSDAPILSLHAVTSDGIKLYKLSGAEPLLRIAQEPRAVSTVAESTSILAGPTRRPVATYEWDRAPAAVPPLSGRGIVRSWNRPRGDVVSALAECEGQALLVFNETCDPGWSATVNGREVPVLRVNAVAQGVCVPSGRSEVLFRYRPRGLVAGQIISGLAWAALGCGVAFARRGSGRTASPTAHTGP